MVSLLCADVPLETILTHSLAHWLHFAAHCVVHVLTRPSSQWGER